jgi:hypothetical protein
MPYQFRGQHRDEEVILICRQHPFVLLKSLLVAVVIFLIPFIVGIFMMVGDILAVTIIFALLGGIGVIGMAIYGWWNTLFLLTTERAVLLEQHNPVSRKFSEANLGSVLQVSHEIRGVAATLCGFGSVTLYTGGVQRPFVAPNLPEPYEIQQEIQAIVAGEKVE